jgi:hypothetical protein
MLHPPATTHLATQCCPCTWLLFCSCRDWRTTFRKPVALVCGVSVFCGGISLYPQSLLMGKCTCSLTHFPTVPAHAFKYCASAHPQQVPTAWAGSWEGHAYDQKGVSHAGMERVFHSHRMPFCQAPFVCTLADFNAEQDVGWLVAVTMLLLAQLLPAELLATKYQPKLTTRLSGHLCKCMDQLSYLKIREDVAGSYLLTTREDFAGYHFICVDGHIKLLHSSSICIPKE